MAGLVYNSAEELFHNGGLDWDTSTGIKVMLVTSGYTPDADHQYVSEVTPASNELSGTGYTGGYGGSGRKALSARAVTKDNANNRVLMDDTADVTWSAINAGTPAYAVVFREVTSDALSPLIACVAINSPVATNGGDYTLQWDAKGLFYTQE